MQILAGLSWLTMSQSKSHNAFEVLGLTPEFAIDGPALERAYLMAQSKWHPDRFPDPDERAKAERRAAAINDAHRVLSNPERRAGHLLSILGGPAKEADRTLPDGFLMEMLEVREAMESDLATGDEAGRGKWKTWASERRAAVLGRVVGLFERIDHTDGVDDRASLLTQVRIELNAWRYIERMIEQLDPDYDHQRELRDAGG